MTDGLGAHIVQLLLFGLAIRQHVYHELFIVVKKNGRDSILVHLELDGEIFGHSLEEMD